MGTTLATIVIYSTKLEEFATKSNVDRSHVRQSDAYEVDSLRYSTEQISSQNYYGTEGKLKPFATLKAFATLTAEGLTF